MTSIEPTTFAGLTSLLDLSVAREVEIEHEKQRKQGRARETERLQEKRERDRERGRERNRMLSWLTLLFRSFQGFHSKQHHVHRSHRVFWSFQPGGLSLVRQRDQRGCQRRVPRLDQPKLLVCSGCLVKRCRLDLASLRVHDFSQVSREQHSD
jgi:hypothetical protein